MPTQQISFWRRIIEVYRPFRKPIGMVLLFLFGVQLMGLAPSFIFGKLITLIIKGAPFNMLVAVAAFSLAATLIQAALNFWRDQYEIKYLDFAIPNHAADITIDKLFELSIGQHRNENSGMTRSVISEGESSLVRLVNNLLYNLLPIITQTLVTLTAMFLLDPTIGFISLAGAIVFIGWCLYNNKQFADSIKQHRDLGHKNNKLQNEILRNLAFIEISSQEKQAAKEYNKIRQDWAVMGQNIWSRFIVPVLGRTSFIGVIKFAVIVVGVLQISHGQMEAGTLVTLVMWTNFLTNNLGQIMPIHREYLQTKAAVKKYFTILDIEPAVKITENPIQLEHYAGNIAFENVTFFYPNTTYIEKSDASNKSAELVVQEVEKPNPEALIDVSFTIKAGQKIGFVGASGAGKSTLMALLLRAYDPNKGKVIIEGHDLRELDPRQYREHLGFVEQNVTMFDNTLRYNLLFGSRHPEAVSEAQIEEVAKQARIDTFYPRLTKGFDTMIGENGIKLSGGERQRVGIARALIKNPSILLLDEATSHLDTVNEKLIKESIDEASKGRTLIVIAHRLSTVKDMDKIFVLDGGKIIGEGKHRTLLRTCPTYKTLVQSQALS